MDTTMCDKILEVLTEIQLLCVKDWKYFIIQLLTISLPILLLLFQRWFIYRKNQKREKKLYISELMYLREHVEKGIAVLNQIDFTKGKPASTHFEKLKITSSSIVFSEKTYRGVDEECLEYLSHSRTTFRNFNKDIECAVKHLESTYNPIVMEKFCNYLLERSENLIERINTSIENMDSIKKIDLNSKRRSTNRLNIPQIIYT